MPSTDGDHLSAEEIEGFVSGGTGAEPGDPELVEQARRHLVSCTECSERLRACQEQQEALNSLNSREAAQGRDCPGEHDWMLLSAGQLAAPVVDKMLQHAAGCDWCGALLRHSSATSAA